MPTDSIQLQIVKNGGVPAIGAITAAFGDTIVLGLGSTASGVRKVKYRIYEFPAGFALPTGWTQEAANCYSVTILSGADAPAFTLPASGIALRGKYFFDAVANDQRVNGSVTGALRSKAQLKIPMATAGLEDVGYLESNEFDSLRQAAGAIKAAIRVLDQAVLSGGGVTDHGVLTGLADDDHTQYEFAARPLTTAYTAASNDAALLDSRKCIITTRATAITLRIRLQASIVWLTETLLGGINTGAGTLTITAEAGVTLNGSVTVPQNGWWWAKRTALNTWQIFTGGTGGGGGGTGDLKADGTVAMTANFDLGTHKAINGVAGTASTDFVIKSQLDAVAAATSGKYGFQYTFGTGTTNVDPTSGKLAFDSATPSAVARINVDLIDADGNDLTNWLAALDDAIGTIKGFIYWRALSDDTKWGMYRLDSITSPGGYVSLNVTHIVSGTGGLPATTAGEVTLEFDAWGNGAAAGNGLTGTSTHSVLAEDTSVTVGAGGVKVSSQLPARGTENVALDLYPATQAQGTLATAASVTFDIPIPTGKRVTTNWDIWVDDGAGGACLYQKAITTKYHQTGGAAVEISDVTTSAPLEGLGFTFTVAPSTTNARGTLSNTSGSTRSYNIAIGSWSMDKP
jgi:hypothetical protein